MYGVKPGPLFVREAGAGLEVVLHGVEDPGPAVQAVADPFRVVPAVLCDPHLGGRAVRLDGERDLEGLLALPGEDELPRQWYNLAADLPTPMQPPIAPDGTVVPPQGWYPIFPEVLVDQEYNMKDRWIDIPEEVLGILKIWRPTPLYRARRLEKALGTPAKIFYKNEGVSPPGSHKPNTAVTQAYYNREFGIKRLTTETGAGQWGCALALGCKLMGLECKVYMVRVSYDQKPYRRIMMETWGATCVPSPSPDTKTGRDMLAKDPDCPGSLGLAISEAVEDAMSREDTHYSLGSVLNHVLMHQTVIGLESRK